MKRWGTLLKWTGRGGGAAVAVLVLALLSLDRALPPDLQRYEERSTIVLDAQGEILRAFTTSDGMWRLGATSDDVDANFVRMLVAYEDQRYYVHPGVDPLALGRALGQWAAAGRPISGASTLTMQTARLLEPRPRTIAAKVLEMARALQLEWRYSKSEILDIYLTLAPYGGNIEGVRAASLAYFGREPAELTPSQSAILVALPRSPERLRPDRFQDALAEARNLVLARVMGTGLIDAQVYDEALEDPVPHARATLPFRSPHLARRLYGASQGATEIQTHIDGPLQDYVEQLARQTRLQLEPEASMAALVVENATGRVVAYLGAADFWAPAGQVDLVRAERSPGSALKPFIYGLAFEDLLLHPETLIDDRTILFGAYAPQNFDREHLGTISVRTALQQSLNVPAVAVLDQVGPMRLAARLRQAGAALSFGQLGAEPSLPLALGGVGITLEDLTMLYAGIAREGAVPSLRFVDGADEDDSRQIMSATAAWYLDDVLRGSPLPEGFGQAQGALRPQAIAFKTGTSYGYRDAWAIGFTGAYTVGVWVGRADGSPRPGSYGRNTAAPLLFQIFDQMDPSDAGRDLPDDIIIARSYRDLPTRLRFFEPPGRDFSVAAQQRATPLQIAFPPPGTVVDLTSTTTIAMPLRANGGTPPLRWLIDGEVLPASDRFERPVWEPREPGFVEITVIDAAGEADHAAVRLRITP